MLSCKDVVELVGTDAVYRASLGTRLRVRMHLLMCRHCRGYVRSIRQLAESARRMVSDAPSSAERERALMEAMRRAIANADEAPGTPSP